MSNRTVNFNVHKLAAFKRAYEAASAEQEQHFKFEGDIYLTSYARYLIEYLEPRFSQSA